MVVGENGHQVIITILKCDQHRVTTLCVALLDISLVAVLLTVRKSCRSQSVCVCDWAIKIAEMAIGVN